MGLFDLLTAKSASPRDPFVDLYRAVMAQSRNPRLFQLFEIPDTPDGRFDLLIVHMHMVLRRLKDKGDAAQNCAQSLFEQWLGVHHL